MSAQSYPFWTVPQPSPSNDGRRPTEQSLVPGKQVDLPPALRALSLSKGHAETNLQDPGTTRTREGADKPVEPHWIATIAAATD